MRLISESTCTVGKGETMRIGEVIKEDCAGYKFGNAYLEDKFLLVILNFVIHFETLKMQ